jgi:putative component of membrane protein insertase Oxa1/YidC/SpoIIIJ protein YidD
MASGLASSALLEILLRKIVLAAIRAYQRFLSPHKGYRCAYRAHTARPSCSALGYRAVRMHGIGAGLALLRERLFLCSVAHRRYRAPAPCVTNTEAGFCDLDLPCDISSEAACVATDACDLDGCGGEQTRGKRKKSQDESSIHLPPRIDPTEQARDSAHGAKLMPSDEAAKRRTQVI